MASDSKVRAYFFPPTYLPEPPTPPLPPLPPSHDKGKAPVGADLTVQNTQNVQNMQNARDVLDRRKVGGGDVADPRDVLDRRKGVELELDRAGLGVREVLLEAGRMLEGVWLECLAKLLKQEMEGDAMLKAGGVGAVQGNEGTEGAVQENEGTEGGLGGG